MNNSPIFVCGPNRSGTSLLYALLASHPNISMVQRTDMWRFFYQRYGDLSQPKNFERCLAAMLHYRRITRLDPDPQRIRAEFAQGAPTYGRLFGLFHEHYAQQREKPRWGDKSLHTELHADAVFAEFPAAKMIHVIRDPRDRYASEHKKYNASVAAATSKWLFSSKAAIKNVQQYSKNYLVVCYESLATHPTETLKQVCAFINESYTPAMLTMRGAPEHLEQRGDSSFEQFEPGEISTRSIGRFRKVISKRDIAFIQAYAQKEMIHFDYQIDPIHLTGRNRLAYYFIDQPIGFVRMVHRYTQQKIREKRGWPVPKRRLLTEQYSVRLKEA